jgi:hypothetical protein
MKFLSFTLLFLMQVNGMAAETYICQEIEQTSSEQPKVAKMVVTLEDGEVASPERIKLGIEQKEIFFGQYTFEEDLDSIRFAKVKIESVLGDQRETLKDISTFLFDEDNYVSVENQTQHNFFFALDLDDLEYSILISYSASEGKKTHRLTCELKK